MATRMVRHPTKAGVMITYPGCMNCAWLKRADLIDGGGIDILIRKYAEESDQEREIDEITWDLWHKEIHYDHKDQTVYQIKHGMEGGLRTRYHEYDDGRKPQVVVHFGQDVYIPDDHEKCYCVEGLTWYSE